MKNILCNKALGFLMQHLEDPEAFSKFYNEHIKTCEKCNIDDGYINKEHTYVEGKPHLKTITVNGEDVQVIFRTTDDNETPY